MSGGGFEAALAAGPVVLDGGLATQLEARGHDLSDSLWSARLLLDDPDEVRAAHADFFAAGAQVATTASYQVSESGFRAAGFSPDDVAVALRRSVEVAREAAAGEPRRWVAASVGPYGAALADGSEYRGDYGLTVDELREWHRPRLHALAEAGADVLALETIPCLAEAEALLAEVAELGVPAWLSMTVVGDRTRLGEPVAQAYAMAADVANIVAVGANCFAPADVPAVLTAAAPAGRPVVVYPNSGETWNADARHWEGMPTIDTAHVRGWLDGGARLVGGCCRVTPALVRDIAAAC